MQNEIKGHLALTVLRVALLNLNIDESLRRETGAELEFAVTQNTGFQVQKDEATFKLNWKFTYKDSNETPIDITVLTVFGVKGFKAMVEEFKPVDVKSIIPRAVLVTCLSVAMNNTRATLLQQLATTVYNGIVPMPIYDAVEVAKTLYPEGATPTVKTKPRKKS